MLQVRSSSPAETRRVAAALAPLVRARDVVVLAGEMGAGKTVFAQALGAALGVTETMTSPTYNLVHSHAAGRLTVHHADLYRLGSNHEVADLALAELAESDGIVLVEWGDVVAAMLGDHLVVRLEAPIDDSTDTTGDDSAEGSAVRQITFSATGRSWATRWASIELAVGGAPC